MYLSADLSPGALVFPEADRSGPFTIGARSIGGVHSNFLPATIDEPAVFDHALSPELILQAFEAAGSYDLVPYPDDPQQAYGWEEVYGHDFPYSWQEGQPFDVPTLENAFCRVRFDAQSVPGLRVDGWDGERFSEQGKLTFLRSGEVGGAYLTRWQSAVVREWTPDRAVIQAVLSSDIDAHSRERVLVTLQRGWTGPRVEMYLAPKGDGSRADGLFIWTLATLDSACAFKLDTGGAGVAVNPLSGLFAAGALGAGTFAGGENFVAITRFGAGVQTNLAVLQSGMSASVTSETSGYGRAHPAAYILSTGASGYASVHLGCSPQADQALIAADIRSASTTSTVVADVNSPHGRSVKETQTAELANTLVKDDTALRAGAVYRAIVTVRVDAGVSASLIASVTGDDTATFTSTSTARVAVDLGELTPTVSGPFFALNAWASAGSGGVYIDEVLLLKLEDRVSGSYDGARDHGQAALSDSRVAIRRVARG